MLDFTGICLNDYPSKMKPGSGRHIRERRSIFLRRGDRLFGIECKRADAPRLTPSIRIALEDLGLERVAVIYPVTKRYRLSDRVEVVPLAALVDSAV